MPFVFAQIKRWCGWHCYPPLKNLANQYTVILFWFYMRLLPYELVNMYSTVTHRDFLWKGCYEKTSTGFGSVLCSPFPGGSCERGQVDFLDGVLRGHQQLLCRVSARLHNRTKLWRVKIAAHLFCLHVQESGSAVANKVGWHKGGEESYSIIVNMCLGGWVAWHGLLNWALHTHRYCSIINQSFLSDTNTRGVLCLQQNRPKTIPNE